MGKGEGDSMKAGEALSAFFTTVLGLKADDPGLKDFLSDPELAKAEINTVKDFGELFMTFQQAQKNKGLVQVIEEAARKTAFGEYLTTQENAMRKWGRENGIEPEEMNQIFKDHSQQDKRIPVIMKLIDEKARKASGQSKQEWEEEKKKLWDENNGLKRKLDEETTRITGEFTGKLTAKEKEMILLQMKVALPGVMKFNPAIPALGDIQDLRLRKEFIEKFHIVNDNGVFRFYDPNDPSKEVFDEKGKPRDFGKMVVELFPIAEFGETGKTGANGSGKTTVVPAKEGDKTKPKEVLEKLEEIAKNRPRTWVPE